MFWWKSFETLTAELRPALPGGEVRDSDVAAVFAKWKARDVRTFFQGVVKRMNRSHRWDIGAISGIVTGMIGVEFWTGFETWLILQGDLFFESALKNPELAVSRLDEDEPFTSFSYRPMWYELEKAWEAKTGEPIRISPSDHIELEAPGGTPWTWRELPAMHRDLWQRFFIARDRRPRRARDLLSDPDRLIWQAREPVIAWLSIYSEPEYVDMQLNQLSQHQRAVGAVSWMKSEVCNGGIDQFFWNSTGVLARAAQEGLVCIGAPRYAAYLEKVMSSFPGGVPARGHDARQLQMDQMRAASNGLTIDEMLPRFHLEDLDTLCANYVSQNFDSFFRSPRT